MDETLLMHRFHPRATKPAPENTVPLPRDVRASGRQDDGTGYLFRPGELLVPQEATLQRYAGLADALRDEGAIPWEEFQARVPAQDASYPEGMSEHQREVLDAKRAERRALAERGLATAGMQRWVIPRLADPENTETDDMPDVLDRLLRVGRDERRKLEGADAGEPSPKEEWPVFANFVLTGADDDGVFGPGEPVRQLDEFFEPDVDETLGEGIRIAVVDTGVRADHEWLAGSCETRPLIDEETLDTAPPFGELDFEAGHGTFIAGVIKRFAPRATIVMRGVVDSTGIIDDLTLAGAIDQLEEALPLHILNLSLGGYVHKHWMLTPDGRTELTVRDPRVHPVGLPATAAAIQRLQRTSFDRHGIRLVVAAAAGNDNSVLPFYPAALPTVIGVGALNQDYSKAIWSNYGDWVDAWEIGANVVSSFVGPELDKPGGGGTGKEGAFWGGTSFATPRFVGLLAAAMTV